MEAKNYKWSEFLMAGNPLVWLVTHENLRARTIIKDLADRMGKSLVVWDCLGGAASVLDRDPIKALAAMKEPAFPDRVVVIMENLHLFLKNPMVIQGVKNCIAPLKDKDINLVNVCPCEEIPTELVRDFALTELPLPNRDELRQVLVKTADWLDGYDPAADDPDSLVDAAAGLTAQEAEDAFSMNFAREGKLSPDGVALMKSKMIKQQACLSWVSFPETFETLGGFDTAKSWALNRFKNRRPELPWNGMLMLGIPGCGKTHFAKALGNEVGWPVIEFNLSTVGDSKVGGSEKKMADSIKAIQAVGKCVVILDEIEKGLAGVGGATTDSGAAKKSGNILLQWLQSPGCDAFVVATCNDIKELPAPYVRSGRWGGIFFVDLPDDAERKTIKNIYLTKYFGKTLDDYPNFPSLEHYSGAEIQQVIIEGAYNGGDFQAAAKFIVPQYNSRREEIETLRKEAQTQWAIAGKAPLSSRVFDSIDKAAAGRVIRK